ncbi:MAG: acyl-CoA dehydrogenase family protein [Acidimicrobiales bacterium]
MLDVATAAGEIVEPLKSTCDGSESTRQLSPEAAALMHQAGLTKIVTPASHGGYQMTVRDLVEAERIIAHGSSAASWVLMVTGAHTFIAGRLPSAGLDEIFGADPGVLIPGVPSTRPGRAVRVEGGYRLTGRWPYASGADVGQWYIVGATGTVDETGTRCPTILAFLPADDISLDDTWFTTGMRGTGSKDIVLDDVFVPDHLTVRASAAVLGTVEGVDVGLYRLPVQATLATMLLGSIVGMAEAFRDIVIEQAKTRRHAYTGTPKVESAGMQRRVAEASGEIAAAWALTQQSCDMLDAAMNTQPPMPIGLRSQVRWNAAFANELCLRATNRLLGASGAGAAHKTNPLERLYRDISTATRHAMLDFDTAVEMHGQHLLGLELEDGLV